MTIPVPSSDQPDRELLRQQEIAHQLNMIRSNLASTRAAAARRLGELKSGVDALLGALQDHFDNVRIAAAGALGSFYGDDRAPEIIDALLSAIDDPSERVGQAAIRSLGLLRALSAREEIEEFLEDSNPYIAGAAMLSLARMGAADLAPRMAEYLEHESMYLKTQAVRALGMLNYTPAGPKMVELLEHSRQLRQSIGRPDPQAYLEHREDDLYTLQNQLVRAISALKVKQAAPLLVDIAQKDVGLRGLAVEGLIAIQAELAPEVMAGLFSDPSAGLRRRLIGLMSQQDYRQALPFLRKMLHEHNVAARSAAMQALTQMRDMEALPQLEWIAYSDPNPFARVQAVQSISGLLGAESVPRLLPLTRDANFEVRRSAVLHLYERLPSDPDSLAALARFARDFPKDVLSNAINNRLGEMAYTLPMESELTAECEENALPAALLPRSRELAALLQQWRDAASTGVEAEPKRVKTVLALEHLLDVLKKSLPK